MALHCHECGFVNDEAANYCQKCGAYLGRSEGTDEPSTLTYKIAETGEFQPIDIDQMVEEEGAALVERLRRNVERVRPGHPTPIVPVILGDEAAALGAASQLLAHGLLVPVWDLPHDVPAVDWDAPLAEFAKRYAEALTVTDPLTPAERRSRQGLLGRQLTLR